MRFEPNKYYKHSTGRMLHTLEMVNTTMYGRTLAAEEAGSCNLVPVGTDSDDYTQNYVEITEEEWMTNFDSKESGKSDRPKLTAIDKVEYNSPIGYRETNEIAEAWRTLDRAIAIDYDYAWAVFCNLVMPVSDTTHCSHELATKAGVQLMRHLFAYDVTGLQRYHDITKQYDTEDIVGQEPPPTEEKPRPTTEAPCLDHKESCECQGCINLAKHMVGGSEYIKTHPPIKYAEEHDSSKRVIGKIFEGIDPVTKEPIFIEMLNLSESENGLIKGTLAASSAKLKSEVGSIFNFSFEAEGSVDDEITAAKTTIDGYQPLENFKLADSQPPKEE